MWVDVDGGRLHLETAGHGSRPGSAILLLHGWPLDHRIFAPQIRYLKRSFRVVAFDRRGFGRSEAPPDLCLELDDIDRILDALGLEAVHLLGMSQGARIALRFAVMRAGRIRSMILQAPVIDGIALDESSTERIPMGEFAMLARAGRLGEVRSHWLEHPMMALDAKHARLRREVEEIVAGYQGKDLLDYSPKRQTFPHDVLESLSRLDKAFLILTGAHDTAVRREHARRLLEAIPRSREIVFLQSGHLSNLTEPKAYNRHVTAFCASVDGTAQERDGGATQGTRKTLHKP
ncbi:MAG: alpha/beta fold hydrolase [Woeseiaceae bacterium]